MTTPETTPDTASFILNEPNVFPEGPIPLPETKRPTEFHVEVVRIGPTEKLANADTLQLTRVRGDYPVLFRTGQFQEGDLAVYVPLDALVDTRRAEFAFLAKPKAAADATAGETAEADEEEDEDAFFVRIKAKRLRGTFSMGLLVEVPDSVKDHAKEGDDVAEALGVEKWESAIDKLSTGGPKAPAAPAPKGLFIPEYGLDALRHYERVAFTEGEEVIITEKIHGCNARFVRGLDGELHVGSRVRWTIEGQDDVWWPCVRKTHLDDALAKVRPGLVVYGEVYGQVQDLTYDHPKGEVSFRAFDVFDGLEGKWLDYEDAQKVLTDAGIPTVPVLYRGPWQFDLRALASGQSVLASNIKEGIVVRSLKERRTEKGGRCVLKHHGEEYLLKNSEGAAKKNKKRGQGRDQKRKAKAIVAAAVPPADEQPS